MSSESATTFPPSIAEHAPETGPAGPGDLEDRFLQFADLCATFNRTILRSTGGRSSVTPRWDVQRNLAFSRLVFGKWGVETLLVLYTNDSGLGFEALRRSIGAISPRVLSIKLRTLQDFDLVRREVLSTRPPRVNYSLTPSGHALAKMAGPIFLYLDRCRRRAPTPTAGGSVVRGRPASPGRSLLSPRGMETPASWSGADETFVFEEPSGDPVRVVRGVPEGDHDDLSTKGHVKRRHVKLGRPDRDIDSRAVGGCSQDVDDLEPEVARSP